MKFIKIYTALLLSLAVSGCYRDIPYEEPRMQLQAELLCKDFMGVYTYGYGGDFGVVMCFKNQQKFNVFTGEEVK